MRLISSKVHHNWVCLCQVLTESVVIAVNIGLKETRCPLKRIKVMESPKALAHLLNT